MWASRIMGAITLSLRMLTNNLKVKWLYQERNSLAWQHSSSTTIQLLQNNCFFCPSLTERHQALLATSGLESSVCHQQISVAGGLWHGWAVAAAAAGEWAPQYVSAPWLRKEVYTSALMKLGPKGSFCALLDQILSLFICLYWVLLDVWKGALPSHPAWANSPANCCAMPPLPAIPPLTCPADVPWF